MGGEQKWPMCMSITALLLGLLTLQFLLADSQFFNQVGLSEIDFDVGRWKNYLRNVSLGRFSCY